MDPDSVEVKITIAGKWVVPSALDAFGLSVDRPGWRIYFCEDVARLTRPCTPLLDAGIILRARIKSQQEGDTTVKLRPGRRSQLTEHWLRGKATDDAEFKIEADWAGPNKVLAVSHTADVRPTRSRRFGARSVMCRPCLPRTSGGS